MTIGKKEISTLAINGKLVAALTINGRPAYSGGTRIDLSLCKIEAVYTKVLYTGQPVTAEIEITDPEETRLVEGKDYVLEWFDNVEPGTARVVARGKGGYKGTLETTFEIVSNNVSTKGYDFEIDPDEFPADASSFDVKVVTAIDAAHNRMVEGTDFYYENDNNGIITIYGTGKYTGRIIRTYRLLGQVDYLTFSALEDGSTLKLVKSRTPAAVTL